VGRAPPCGFLRAVVRPSGLEKHQKTARDTPGSPLIRISSVLHPRLVGNSLCQMTRHMVQQVIVILSLFGFLWGVTLPMTVLLDISCRKHGRRGIATFARQGAIPGTSWNGGPLSSPPHTKSSFFDPKTRIMATRTTLTDRHSGHLT
jgi:hypothetical protein